MKVCLVYIINVWDFLKGKKSNASFESSVKAHNGEGNGGSLCFSVQCGRGGGLVRVSGGNLSFGSDFGLTNAFVDLDVSLNTEVSWSHALVNGLFILSWAGIAFSWLVGHWTGVWDLLDGCSADNLGGLIVDGVLGWSTGGWELTWSWMVFTEAEVNWQ